MKTVIRIFKYFLITIISLVGVLVLFVLLSVIPIDRTPYRQQPFYEKMRHNLKSAASKDIPAGKHGFAVGFAKANITPGYHASIAGIGLRKLHYKSIHDSIYVRTLVVNNGIQTIALVSADLLIIPPTVTALLEQELPEVGFSLDNTYLSATHTHSSIGNWGKNLVGELYSGPYNDSLVHFLVHQIVSSVSSARANMLPSSISMGVIPVTNAVTNRLADEAGGVDSLLRVIEVQRSDSSKLLLTSFTGHATCARFSEAQLSRDYPGVLVDELEARGYEFAMFMAGAVGSHACKAPMNSGWDKVEYMGKYLANALLDRRDSFKILHDSSLFMLRVPLVLGEPQVKISQDWRVRPWLFRTFFGEYPATITALRIGDIVMLGTPCDFSGELTAPIDSTAHHHGLRSMVTSFNGGYIGYITRDKWYDVDHYETRIMNWFGPGNGAYLSECLEEMVSIMDINTPHRYIPAK